MISIQNQAQVNRWLNVNKSQAENSTQLVELCINEMGLGNEYWDDAHWIWDLALQVIPEE